MISKHSKKILSWFLVLFCFSVSFAQFGGGNYSISGSSTVYVGETKQYVLSGSSISSTTWGINSSYGNVDSSQLTTAWINFTAPGSTTVDIAIEDNMGDFYFESINVTVNPGLSSGSISGIDPICYSGNPGNLSNSSSASGGPGGYVYQWEISSDNSIWSDISGAESSSYNPPVLTASRWYQRKVTSGSFTETTNTVKITVNPPLEPGIINGADTICYGGNPSALGNAASPSNGIGGYSYQWEISSDNNAWSSISGATLSTYNPPALTASRWYRRIVMSCSQTKYTSPVKVTVKSPLNPGIINGAQPVCAGGDPSALGNAASPSNGIGGYSYQWEISSDNNAWSSISGATLSTYNPPALTASRWYRRIVMSCGQTKYTNTVEITVTAQPIWYADTDGDGYGDSSSTTTNCSEPSGYVSNDDDYDDSTDNITNISPQYFYKDIDVDGFGDPNDSVYYSIMPSGYVTNDTDQCPLVFGTENGCDTTPPTLGNENYVFTRSYQVSLDNSTGIGADSDVIESVAYFDGLGRAKQQTSIKASPDKKDIITHIEYDAYGRQTKQWLPYEKATGIAGSYQTGNIGTEIKQYYQSNYADDFVGVTDENLINAYSQKLFEPSPLNRVLKQAAPGEAWKLDPTGDDHSIAFEYLTNTTTDEVRLFTVTTSFADNTYTPTLAFGEDTNSNTVAYYEEGQLNKTVTKDENHTGTSKNHTTEEFTDKQGRVVLKRTYADITGVSESRHDTYYVYDDYGNLSYVLPPKMEGSSASLSNLNNQLNELGYQYIYDHRNRMVEKQIPGKDKEYIVYNKLDQPIMTQDANQRANDEWLFTKYDAFGRVAYTGKAVDDQERINVQDDVDALTTTLWVEQQISASSIGDANIYYNDVAYPTSTLTEVLTVNYYDSYVDEPSGAPQSITILEDPNNATQASNVKGLATVSRVKVLDQVAAKWINTLTYYDGKGRPIYTYSENEFLQIVDIAETQLDFIGKPLKSRTTHIRDSETIITIDNFTYDHTGRLLAQTQCVGGATMGNSCPDGTITDTSTELPLSGSISGTEVHHNSIVVTNATLTNGARLYIDPSSNGSGGEQELIVFNEYDNLGQLKYKKVGGTPNISNLKSSQGLQQVDYTYNVRGWLKEINEVANIGADLFSFKIGYNESNVLYNGNIAQTQWRSANQDNGLKAYDYTYDALNRITSGLDDTGNYNLQSITYDKNGNIKSLSRQGHIVANPDLGVDMNNDGQDDHFGDMDVLDYAYNDNEMSNRLYKVRDDANDTFGFSDSSTDVQDYWYDDNGNMTRDLNKGIGNTSTDGITYNHLNLPTEVSINNGPDVGTISYIYDATGVKLQKNVLKQGDINPTNTDYAGNYIYENNNLQFFSHGEGYTEPKNPDDLSQGFDYIYQYTDHLGNIRLSYKDVSTTSTPNLEIQEENNYYPFGLKHKGYNNVQSANRDHKYGFGGKEEQDEVGLEWLDFGARNYDASLGRWMNLDNLSEDYYNYSPYTYTANNPIYYTDPDGQRIIIHYQDEDGNDQEYVYEYGGTYDGDNQFVKDVYTSLSHILDNDADTTGVIEALSGDKIGDVDILQNTKENNPLIKNSNNQTFFYKDHEGNNGVIFDPTKGAEVTETKGLLSFIMRNGYKDVEGVLSPSLLFLHELAHAKSSLEDPDQHKEDTDTPLTGGWDNREEFDVIKNVENPAAEKLGQVQRNAHRGFLIKVLSPTSTTRKKKK